jgi:hypothetical protein
MYIAVLLPIEIRNAVVFATAPNISVAVTPLDRRLRYEELLADGRIDLAISNFPLVSGRPTARGAARGGVRR